MTLLPLGILAAAVAIVAAVFLRGRRGSVQKEENGAMVALLEAAAQVSEAARREKLALVVVAERNGANPVAWFAQSIAGVVEIWKKSGAGEFEATGRGDADLQSLYIRKRDIETYLRWARTVQ